VTATYGVDDHGPGSGKPRQATSKRIEWTKSLILSVAMALLFVGCQIGAGIAALQETKNEALVVTLGAVAVIAGVFASICWSDWYSERNAEREAARMLSARLSPSVRRVAELQQMIERMDEHIQKVDEQIGAAGLDEEGNVAVKRGTVQYYLETLMDHNYTIRVSAQQSLLDWKDLDHDQVTSIIARQMAADEVRRQTIVGEEK